jgi:transposase
MSASPEALPEASPRMPAPTPPDELSRAQRRIAELERKVGQQQVDLDFFQQALRHVREAGRPTGAPGGTASTRSSKR